MCQTWVMFDSVRKLTKLSVRLSQMVTHVILWPSDLVCTRMVLPALWVLVRVTCVGA